MNLSPEARLALAARLWGWEPHPGQRELLTLRLDEGSEPRVLVAACGRRWGKTEALGCDVATRLLTDPDLGQLIVAPTRDQADGLFDSVEEKIAAVRADPEALSEFPHIADLVVKRSPYAHMRRKRDGAMVLSARSAGRNGRNLRGKGTTRKVTRFRVVVDEAAFVPDAAIEEAIRPMLATVPGGGGQLVEIGSPYGRRGHFYEAFLKGERREGKYRAVRLPSEQNPRVDPEYLDEMRREMTDRAFKAEFLAEFVDAAGAVFLEDDIKEALCDDDYGLSPLWGVRYVAGIDFGRRGDYTVVAVLEVSAAGLRLVELHRVQGLGWASQLAQVADVLQRWGCKRACPDRTGVGDALCDSLVGALIARRCSCEVDEFVFTFASKPVLIDGVSLALAHRQLRFPPHPVLLSELRNFEILGTVLGRDRMAAARGHDDTVCALALAVHAAAPLRGRVEGAAIGATAGVRVIGSTRSRSFGTNDDKEADFTCALRSGIGSADSGDTGRRRTPRVGSRVLALAYRFGGARRAGAWVRSIMR